jgi:hypothetical protein
MSLFLSHGLSFRCVSRFTSAQRVRVVIPPRKCLYRSLLFAQADRAAAEERLAEAMQALDAWASRFDDLRSLVQYHPSSGSSAPTAQPSAHQPSNCCDLFVALFDATLGRCVA